MNPLIDHCCFSWHGLPTYAARCLKQAGCRFPVIATRPKVPMLGIEEILGGNIVWVEDSDAVSWSDMGLTVPRLFFQASWCTPVFNRLGAEVRAKGGQVIVMFDNRFRRDMRQLGGAIIHRTLWRNRFAAAWVPGASGAKLARLFGFDTDRIFTGLYASDPSIFDGELASPTKDRPKKFVFVGQLIERKGLSELLAAWSSVKEANPDWELHIFGVGRLTELVESHDVVFHGFQQSDVVASALRSARFLILPSHEEHWGLVVCEAAQMGCGLLLSDAVGSREDLATSVNSWVYPASDARQLAFAMENAISMDSAALSLVEKESRRLGGMHTPETWTRTFRKIVDRVG